MTDAGSAAHQEVYNIGDAQEGPRASAAKRKSKWKGCQR
jgi:hypothetical protein